jgi:hypothetical protein
VLLAAIKALTDKGQQGRLRALRGLAEAMASSASEATGQC